ncbi:hypothetical protein FSP39_006884 [Pinctada imbricata]|uniref:Cyclic nucleotide-binding domain-containing protein n=1 Tax=Pinctada imbricata TaxID=66713 RepID=A0AA89C0Y7_PINIB|nr:hypothetical protein FSP39_006884 [Pinctada imbricata]
METVASIDNQITASGAKSSVLPCNLGQNCSCRYAACTELYLPVRCRKEGCKDSTRRCALCWKALQKNRGYESQNCGYQYWSSELICRRLIQSAPSRKRKFINMPTNQGEHSLTTTTLELGERSKTSPDLKKRQKSQHRLSVFQVLQAQSLRTNGKDKGRRSSSICKTPSITITRQDRSVTSLGDTNSLENVDPLQHLRDFHERRPSVMQRRASVVQREESTFLTRLRKSISIDIQDPGYGRHRGPVFEKFRQIAQGIRLLIRWFRIIIEISDEKTTRTATEEQWYTLYTSQEARKLAFNKSMFARERAFARVPFWAIKIFECTPEERSEADCRRIHALLRGLKSFDKFTERIQLYMCRSFRYQCVEPGRVILRKGHVGFNFYFIYSGSVFVNIQDINIEGKKFEKTETILARGDSFGELALLQDIRRTASITCRERCEMLVVDKETFAKVCPSIFDEELKHKEQFLSGLPLFSATYWTREMLKLLCTEAHIQEYKTNKIVSTDSDDEEWMYICMEGKCQVISRIALDEKNENTLHHERRASTPELSDDIMDIIKNVNKSRDKQEGAVGSAGEGGGQGKERLLESMSLEYRRDGRRRKIMNNPEKEEETKRKDIKMTLHGPLSLTSLMTQDKENEEGRDYMYLNIATVHPEKVFDLYSILYPGCRPSNSAVILVSLGARLLRIKKKIFFDVITSDALAHARIIAKKDRYPTDEQILSSYEEKYNWEIYKHRLLNDVLGEHLEGPRFTKLTNAQKTVIKDHHRRTSKLLSVLQNNTHREKYRYEKEVAELKQLHDKNDKKELKSSADAIILQSLSKYKAQTSKIQHNFVIGRKATSVN